MYNGKQVPVGGVLGDEFKKVWQEIERNKVIPAKGQRVSHTTNGTIIRNVGEAGETTIQPQVATPDPVLVSAEVVSQDGVIIYVKQPINPVISGSGTLGDPYRGELLGAGTAMTTAVLTHPINSLMRATKNFGGDWPSGSDFIGSTYSQEKQTGNQYPRHSFVSNTGAPGKWHLSPTPTAGDLVQVLLFPASPPGGAYYQDSTDTLNLAIAIELVPRLWLWTP